ncbi:hypothetical protein N9549_02910 [Acidimicrobiales bacterium]|jgi:hypothetical protein|nr:hypothetical protein [Acidimicrobiales bacterium]
MADYSDLMDRFRAAYVSGEPDKLRTVLGPGFEWHNHYFLPSDPRPTGRVLHGIDEMIIELLWRKEHWSNVRFVGLREQFAPGHVTQTFTISGIDRGTPFENAAVDLYTVTDDNLIAKKDTYWKYAGG